MITSGAVVALAPERDAGEIANTPGPKKAILGPIRSDSDRSRMETKDGPAYVTRIDENCRWGVGGPFLPPFPPKWVQLQTPTPPGVREEYERSEFLYGPPATRDLVENVGATGNLG